MSFLLDTDICSAFLRGDRRVFSRIVQHGGRLAMSVITLAELEVWARKPNFNAARAQAIKDLRLTVYAIDLTPAIAERFGDIRAQQFAAGQFTPEMDLLIAATALVHNLTLVTHNTKDFADIPGLQLADWLAP